MLDYVKLYLVDIDVERLFDLEVLDFKGEYSKTTAEIYESVFVSKYLFCEIKIQFVKKENLQEVIHVTFKGSIHKMWNELHGVKAPNFNDKHIYKGFNGNQFDYKGIIEVRKHLEELFDCKANQMKFQNIEFGVNTTPDFNPKLYLKGLLYHHNVRFQYRFEENYAQSMHQYFIFKIYNKSFQYGMNDPVLRVELKIIKMQELKGFGIVTFEDINEITLDKAKFLLLKRFDEIMHYDYTLKKKKLSRLKVELLNKYSNPIYWLEDLKPIHRDRPKKDLKQLTIQYSNNIHQQIRDDIIKKCVIINQLFDLTPCVINNNSSLGLNVTHL